MNLLVISFICIFLMRECRATDDKFDVNGDGGKPLDTNDNGSSAGDAADESPKSKDIQEEVQPELSEEEKLAASLYDQAMSYLNTTQPAKRRGYELLLEAAKLNHSKSQELIAKAYLFGDTLPIDLEKAADYFKHLARSGNPVAQMVGRVLSLPRCKWSCLHSISVSCTRVGLA